MKTISFFLVISIITLFLEGVALAQGQEILFGYQDTANFPYEVGDGDKIPVDNPGISIDMVKMVSEKTGITPKLIRLPWKKAIMMTSSGEIDALISASYNEERARSAVYPMLQNLPDSTKKIYTGRYVLFQNKSAPLSWDGKKFTSGMYEIHIHLGYSVANDLKNKGARIVEKPDIKHSFSLLQKKRIDGIAELETSGLFILKKMASDLPDIEVAEYIIKEKDYFIIFSKAFFDKNKRLAEEFWQNISNLKESPEMESIIKRYENQSDN